MSDIADKTTSIPLTEELMAKITETATKAVEESLKAKKEFTFHGTEAKGVKSTKADEKAEAVTWLRDVALGKSVNNSEIISKIQTERTKAISGSTDAIGGYLVPNAFETSILSAFDSYDEIIKDAEVITFNRPGRVLDLNELTSKVTVYRASQDAYAGLTASTPTFSEPQIGLDNYIGSTTIYGDFLEDTEADIMSNLSQQFGERMAYELQAVLISGTVTASGVTSKGIFVKTNGATTVSQATTASGYTAVSASDIEKLFFNAISIAGFQKSNKNGKFYMHPLVLQAIRTNIRNSSSNNDYLSVFDGAEPTIMGRPIVMTNQAPIPTTTVSNPYVVFGDLKTHLKIARKRGITMQLNTQGTSAEGVNLNTTPGSRELVVSQRIGFQLSLVSGLTHLVTA